MLLECVPNISEGRDTAKVLEIVGAVKAVPGVKVLHIDVGKDANRSVITFIGEPNAVLEGAFALTKKASELIDMSTHQGAHPRIGAVDVCPFVPLEGARIEDCISLANQLGKRVGEELNLPVYLYAYAATNTQRKNLSNIRKGEYEGLEEKLKTPSWKPDYGPKKFIPKFGAMAIGARNFLIAFNVNLSTQDLTIAIDIASSIRESSKSPSALKSCKAIGWVMPEYNCAQVSMNLTDFRKTGIFEAFAQCREQAEERGVEITGSQIVGLLPEEALIEDDKKIYLAYGDNKVRKNDEYLDLAVSFLGLSEFEEFKIKERIIEYLLA